jgi:hypothetical protein
MRTYVKDVSICPFILGLPLSECTVGQCNNNYNNYSLSSNGFCPTVVVVSPVVKAPKLRVVTRLIS